jgi:hypothetical protein
VPGATKRVIPLQDKAVRYRHWSMLRRWLSGAQVSQSGHAASLDDGGARIGWPRRKVWMMLIGEPQHGQTKVG